MVVVPFKNEKDNVDYQELLTICYDNIFKLATEQNLRTISMSLLGTGVTIISYSNYYNKFGNKVAGFNIKESLICLFSGLQKNSLISLNLIEKDPKKVEDISQIF